MLKSVFNACLKIGCLQFNRFQGTKSKVRPAVFKRFDAKFTKSIKDICAPRLMDQLTPATYSGPRKKRPPPLTRIGRLRANRIPNSSAHLSKLELSNFFFGMLHRPIQGFDLMKLVPHLSLLKFYIVSSLVRWFPSLSANAIELSKRLLMFNRVARCSLSRLENVYKVKLRLFLGMTKSMRDKRISAHYRTVKPAATYHLPNCIEEWLLISAKEKNKKFSGAKHLSRPECSPSTTLSRKKVACRLPNDHQVKTYHGKK